MKKQMHMVLLALVLSVGALLLHSCGSDGGTTDTGGNGNSNDFRGSIVFTDTWKGEWNVVIAFVDCVDGDTLNIDNITDVICEGDTLDLELTSLVEGCDGSITDSRLTADCAYQFSEGGCTVTLALTLDIERQGDMLVGSGQWSASVSGTCGDYDAGCEDLVISGVRIDTDPADCSGPQPADVADRFSLRPRLFLHGLQQY